MTHTGASNRVAVADGIRNDGAAVAATLLLDAASRTMAIRS